jgi:hypothetical protein
MIFNIHPQDHYHRARVIKVQTSSDYFQDIPQLFHGLHVFVQTNLQVRRFGSFLHGLILCWLIYDSEHLLGLNLC